MNIAVFGATGRTGRYVLEQGLHRGHRMTAFSRRPQTLADVQGLEAVVQGDGRDLARVRETVRGQDAIIAILSSPGLGPDTTVSDVTKTIISGMQQEGVRRLICVSAYPLVATRPWLAVRLVKVIFRNPYADLAVMERAVTGSGLDWTIVRPPQLTNGPATGRVRTAQGDFATGPYTISRADLASALLDAAESADEIRVAIEVSGPAR